MLKEVCRKGGRISDDLLLYICSISNKLLEQIDKEDQQFVIKVNQHLKRCYNCRADLEVFKNEIFTNRADSEIVDVFPEESIELIKRNELYLSLFSMV